MVGLALLNTYPALLVPKNVIEKFQSSVQAQFCHANLEAFVGHQAGQTTPLWASLQDSCHVS